MTSTPILEDMVRQIGGNRVHVTSLVPRGLSIHSFRPAPDDVRRVQDADLIVINGLGLEGWMEKLIRNSSEQAPVIEAAARVTPLHSMGGHDHDEHDAHGHAEHDPNHEGHSETCLGHGPHDPHAWLDVSRVQLYVEEIRDALVHADPAGAETYEALGEFYLFQLRLLDRWIRKQLAVIPPEDRVILVSHNSLSYFEEAYGMTTLPILGFSGAEDSDPKRLAELTERIGSEKIRLAAYGAGENTRLLDQLVEGTDLKTVGPLNFDTLGPADSAEGTYIGMMTNSVMTLVQALKD